MGNLTEKTELEKMAKNNLYGNKCFAWYDNKQQRWFLKLSGMSKVVKLERTFPDSMNTIEMSNALNDMREFLKEKGLDKKEKKKGYYQQSPNGSNIRMEWMPTISARQYTTSGDWTIMRHRMEENFAEEPNGPPEPPYEFESVEAQLSASNEDEVEDEIGEVNEQEWESARERLINCRQPRPTLEFRGVLYDVATGYPISRERNRTTIRGEPATGVIPSLGETNNSCPLCEEIEEREGEPINETRQEVSEFSDDEIDESENESETRTQIEQQMWTDYMYRRDRTISDTPIQRFSERYEYGESASVIDYQIIQRHIHPDMNAQTSTREDNDENSN